MRGVSVIIPTYNREKYIRNAIDSVLGQEYAGTVEVIVSDDGSMDKTLEIAASYGSKVKLLVKPLGCSTQGASGARNRGIEASTQPYILFLDSDDFFLPGHIEKMVHALEATPNVSFVFCRVLEMDESISTELYRPWTKANINAKDIEHLIVTKHNVAHTNGFIFNKNIFKSIGMFDENLRNGEDIDLWMRISESNKGAFSDHFGAVIRKHNSGQLTDISEKILIENHISIFKDAIVRYKKLYLNDKFRIAKLSYIVYKYKLLKFPFTKLFIISLNNLKKSSDEKTDWQPLSQFT